jgi:large subunit ribosomal protein L6
MVKIEKKKKEKNIFLTSFFCNFNLYYIDKELIIPNNIRIYIDNNKIYFKSLLGKVTFNFNTNIYIFFLNNKLYISLFTIEKKKIYINLYTKIIKNKIKGILQGFKIVLIINGLGFKTNIDKNNLILKLGLSHNIIIKIPNKIKIINQKNKLIFYNIDYIYLTQFIYYLRNLKKKNSYKKKGLLLQNEKIILKEGKINKN